MLSHHATPQILLKLIKPFEWKIFGLYLLSGTWGIQSICLTYQLRHTIDNIRSESLLDWHLVNYLLIYCLGYLLSIIREHHCSSAMPALNAHILRGVLTLLKQQDQQTNVSMPYSFIEIKNAIVASIHQIEAMIGQIITICLSITALIAMKPIFGLFMITWLLLFSYINIISLKKQAKLSLSNAIKQQTLMRYLCYQQDHTIMTDFHLNRLTQSEQRFRNNLVSMRIKQTMICLVTQTALLLIVHYLFHKNQMSIGQMTSIIHLSLLIIQTWIFITNQMPYLILSYRKSITCIRSLNTSPKYLKPS